MQAEKDTTENGKIMKVVEKVRADCYSPNLAILYKYGHSLKLQAR